MTEKSDPMAATDAPARRPFFTLPDFRDSASGLQNLSLFRILPGGLIFYDFVFKILPVYEIFYSDRGLVTRAVNFEAHGSIGMLSILNTLDHPWHLAIFAAVFIAATVCFTLGYRTRLANWIVLIGYVGLYERNVMVTSGAEMLVRLFLIWSLFLPMARYWSVDAALDRTPRDVQVPFVLMAAIKMQVSVLYFFSAIFKLSGYTWLNGQAPQWAMHDGVHGTALGAAFADAFPFLMQPMSYAIIAFQFFFPLLVYFPLFNNFFRALALLGALTMHISFIFLLKVGPFPIICMMYLVLLIPDSWLNGLLARRRARLEKIEVFYEPGCGFCEKTARIFREFFMAPRTQVLSADADATALATLRQNNSWVVRDRARGRTYLKWEAVAFVLRQNPLSWVFGVLTDLPLIKAGFAALYGLIGRSRPRLGKLTAATLPFNDQPYHASMATQVLCGVFILLALSSNIFSVPYIDEKKIEPRALRNLISLTQIYQRWNLFAPGPVHYIYDYKIYGVNLTGQHIELDFPMNKGFMRKDGRRIIFQSHRWLKYFHRLYEGNYTPMLRLILWRACQIYNRDPAHESNPLRAATIEMLRLHYADAEAGMPLKTEIKVDSECEVRPMTIAPVRNESEPPAN